MSVQQLADHLHPFGSDALDDLEGGQLAISQPIPGGSFWPEAACRLSSG